MKTNKLLSLFLAITMMLSMACITTVSAAGDVATVDGVAYATIDDAIAAWNDGTTLTLLQDVELSGTITLPSTEHHILNLDNYTMTAASGENAIEITCNGQSTESYALTVNAGENGGITAEGMACIYYNKSGNTQDRPIITINGGVFTGFEAVSIFSSNSGTKCPRLHITGGTFNGYISVDKGKLLIQGGIFNKPVSSSGDSTAYTLISGGSFNATILQSGYMPTSSTIYAIGKKTPDEYTAGSYDVGVYVDDNGYLNVGGPVITAAGTEYEASTPYTVWSNFLNFSSAKDNGLFYTSLEIALARAGKATLHNVFTGDDQNTYTTSKSVTVDMTDPNADIDASIILGKAKHKFTVIYDVSNPFEGEVYGVEDHYVAYTEEIDGTVVTRTYTNVPAVIKNGTVGYGTLADAIADAQDGDTITVCADIAEEAVVIDKNITIDLGGNQLTGDVETTAGATAELKNGSIVSEDASKATITTAGDLTLTDITAAGASDILNVTEGTLTINSGKYTGGAANLFVVGNNASVSVKGGIFDQDPTAYLDDGLTALHDGVTGLWTVIATQHKIDVATNPAAVSGDEIVNVTVTVNGPDFQNAEWKLEFDKNVFDYVGYTDTITTDIKAPVAGDGFVTDSLYTYTSGDVFPGDTVLVTYQFKAKDQPAETTSTFTVTDAIVATSYTANFGDISVEGDSADVLVKLREFGSFETLVTMNGTTTNITADLANGPYEAPYTGLDYVFEVIDPVLDGETVTYVITKDGEVVNAVNAAGTYEIEYTVERIGYKAKTDTFTVVIGDPNFELETSIYTMGNYTLVMVYTDAAGMTPNFDGKDMFDITASGYAYQGTPTAAAQPFNFVYGIVIPQPAAGVDLKALVDFDTETSVAINPYDADVNYVDGVNDRDAVVVINTYNGLPTQMNDEALLSRILKADVNKDKIVNMDDVTAIEKVIEENNA